MHNAATKVENGTVCDPDVVQSQPDAYWISTYYVIIPTLLPIGLIGNLICLYVIIRQFSKEIAFLYQTTFITVDLLYISCDFYRILVQYWAQGYGMMLSKACVHTRFHEIERSYAAIFILQWLVEPLRHFCVHTIPVLCVATGIDRAVGMAKPMYYKTQFPRKRLMLCTILLSILAGIPNAVFAATKWHIIPTKIGQTNPYHYTFNQNTKHTVTNSTDMLNHTLVSVLVIKNTMVNNTFTNSLSSSTPTVNAAVDYTQTIFHRVSTASDTSSAIGKAAEAICVVSIIILVGISVVVGRLYNSYHENNATLHSNLYQNNNNNNNNQQINPRRLSQLMLAQSVLVSLCTIPLVLYHIISNVLTTQNRVAVMYYVRPHYLKDLAFAMQGSLNVFCYALVSSRFRKTVKSTLTCSQSPENHTNHQPGTGPHTEGANGHFIRPDNRVEPVNEPTTNPQNKTQIEANCFELSRKEKETFMVPTAAKQNRMYAKHSFPYMG